MYRQSVDENDKIMIIIISDDLNYRFHVCHFSYFELYYVIVVWMFELITTWLTYYNLVIAQLGSPIGILTIFHSFGYFNVSLFSVCLFTASYNIHGIIDSFHFISSCVRFFFFCFFFFVLFFVRWALAFSSLSLSRFFSALDPTQTQPITAWNQIWMFFGKYWHKGNTFNLYFGVFSRLLY